MKISWNGAEYVAEHSPQEKAALQAYYRDPEVRWFESGTQAVNGPFAGDGYYVLAHCLRIECCRPEGPFKTPAEARDWSRENWLPRI
jgi:hypothetical protein